MSQRTEVIKSIEFNNPSYVPRWFINKDLEKSDIGNYWLFPLGKGETTEWGYKWEHTTACDGTMGMPREPMIPNWEEKEIYKFPDPDSKKKYNEIEKFKKENRDKYQIASMGISGFNTYMFLRGFENTLVDFASNDRRAFDLLDEIFFIENKVIENSLSYGFDGIMFYDDWGMQKNLFVSPDMWRNIFKPRYKKQFKKIHDYGMHVWFHSCGDITSIVLDFNEIGVDVINISQPNVVNIEKISSVLRGKQCFLVPISYQTVSISGSVEDIESEAIQLFKKLATREGGLIGWIEEYSSVGMPEKNYLGCANAFKKLKFNDL